MRQKEGRGALGIYTEKSDIGEVGGYLSSTQTRVISEKSMNTFHMETRVISEKSGEYLSSTQTRVISEKSGNTALLLSAMQCIAVNKSKVESGEVQCHPDTKQ